MTANQISFYKAKNEKEHYERQDKENKRHNLKSEALNQSDLDIKDWYNKASISKDYANIDMLRSHYATADAANVVNANANALQAQMKRESTQLDLSNAYGGVYWDEENQTFLVSPEGWSNGPVGYQQKEEELKKQKLENAYYTFSVWSQNLGSIGRGILSPITNALIKVIK